MPDISPSYRYADARAAIDWLVRAFGFEVKVVHDAPGGEGVAHAELRHGDGLVMLGSTRGDDSDAHAGTGWAYVVIDDVQAHCERARAAGAEIVREPQTEDYGAFYAARDPEGNEWSFGTYRPSLS